METSATALANLTRRSCKSFQTFVKLSVKIAEFSNESCRDHRLAERREKVESSSPVDCSSQAGGQWSRGKRRSTVRHHHTAFGAKVNAKLHSRLHNCMHSGLLSA